MRYYRSLLLLLLLFGLHPLAGQSIWKDAQNMVRALETLRENPLRSDSFDLQSLQATADILAILSAYDTEIRPDSLFTSSNWSDLLDDYADNDLIAGALVDNNFVFSDSLPLTLVSLYGLALRRVDSGPRQRIIDLLQAERVVSPADYLSVRNTLQKYSLPPIQNTTALRQAAEGSNANITGGILNSVAVIQGLFEFILDRAKDEVVVNFLDRMLNKDSPEFTALFPNVISQFSNRDFTYSNSFIQRLRQAFYEDIQQLSVRLPLLLLEDDYFKPLQSEPIAYSFLAIYSMIGMAQNELTIEEILPITHRYLFQSYEEAIKSTNLTLATTAYQQPAYDSLIQQSTAVYNQIAAIYQDLVGIETRLRDSVNQLRQRYPTDSIPVPQANDYLLRSAYNFEVLLGDDSGLEYDLSLLPSLLRGYLDSALVLKYNTLASYDKFFGEERNPQQWRAAGLEIVANLNGTWYENRSIADIFTAWQADLVNYRLQVDRWKNLVDPEGALRAALAEVETNRAHLVDTILATRSFWNTLLTYDEALAFELLASIIADFEDIEEDPQYIFMEEATAQQDQLERKREKLRAVERRLIRLNDQVAAKNTDFQNVNPLQIYLAAKSGVSPYTYITSEIQDLKRTLRAVDRQLALLDATYAQVESQIRDNARPILQATGFATQLMFGLRSDRPEQQWLTKGQLDTLMDGGLQQEVFLGLLTQRLRQVDDVQLLSPNGLTQVVRSTVEDLQTLPLYRSLRGDSTDVVDSLSFYHRAAFFVNTFNRMLEVPLVVDQGDVRQYVSLRTRFPALDKVPDITEQTLDFIYYLNIKDHRHAVSSMLRLFTLLDADIEGEADKTGRRKRQRLLSYLQRYGDFIADLIDAETGAEVEDLLNNLADPPGSSRLKRTERFTVGLNAYLGATVGWDEWTTNRNLPADAGSTTVTPTMPVGISISSLLGREKTASFSLFLSFLDLGALLDFRADSDALGESIFNFRNVFKPGLQVHWNIPKTPFYLAVGGQYGPQVRELEGERINFTATRFFGGFGIDVPIKTLYQR